MCEIEENFTHDFMHTIQCSSHCKIKMQRRDSSGSNSTLDYIVKGHQIKFLSYNGKEFDKKLLRKMPYHLNIFVR